MTNPADRFFGKTKVDALHIDSGAWYIDGEQVVVTAQELNEAIGTYPIYNATGGALTIGMPLHISGFDATNAYFKVEKADANAGKPCQLFAIDTAKANTTTDAKTFYGGNDNGIDCSGSTIGNPVYLSETAGQVTLTKPTASDAFVQILGRVGNTYNPGVLVMDTRFQEISEIGSGQLAGLSVGSAALAAKSVTAAKLGSDVVGAGLAGGNGVAISLAIPNNGINLVNLPIGMIYTAISPIVDITDGVAKDVDFGVIGVKGDVVAAYYNLTEATDEDVALTVCKAISGASIVVPAYNLAATSTVYPNVPGGVIFAVGSGSIVATDHLYVHVPAKASARVAGKFYVTALIKITATA